MHGQWSFLAVKTERCLEIERFNPLDRPVQRARIATFVKRCPTRLVMFTTGFGDPVFDDLWRVLPRVKGAKIIANHSVSVSRGYVHHPIC